MVSSGYSSNNAFAIHLIAAIVHYSTSSPFLNLKSFNYSFLENMTIKNYDVTLLQYEKCFISLNFYNDSYPMNAQPNCSEYAANYLSEVWESSQSFDITTGLPPICLIAHGGRNGPFRGLDRVVKLDGDGLCSIRSILERRGFRSHWQINDFNDNFKLDYPRLLSETMNRHEVDKIYMLGDSITENLSKFFACDLFRAPKYLFPFTPACLRAPQSFLNLPLLISMVMRSYSLL